MKFVIQRVLKAEVQVEKNTVGSIQKGLVVFVGINHSDNQDIANKMLKKLIQLRVFSDEQDKTNLSIMDVEGNFLFVSQFTLYADCRKGNRPSFTQAGNPEVAHNLFEYMKKEASLIMKKPIESGVFGADMKISLVNDGPFTIVLDSKDLGFEC
jgi:D-aminoacyl-tRNA deacylase